MAADNIAVTPGTGATVAADDVSSVLYQRVKLDIGADGASTPVTDLATSAKQDTGNTSLSSLDTKTPSLGQALAASSTPVVLTAAQLTTLTPPAAITGFALAATQTDKSQFTKLTDGTDTALITAAGEQNVLETNSASIKTSVELIDNAISGAGFNITQQGGVAVSLNTGVRDAGTQRVTIATNDAVPVTFTGSTDVATQTTLASLLTSSQLIDDIIFTAGTSTYSEATSKGGLYLAVRRDADTTLADTTNEMVPLQVNATGQLKTAIIAALPAGSAVIGHVITDSGSTTAVTGTVTISGAVTESTLDAALISQEATTSGVKGITAFGAVTTAKPTYTTAKSDALSLDVNGLLRVSLADTPVNGTSLSVNATLTAETTKVIGVVRTADGSGSLLLSAANALNSTGAGVLATQIVGQFDDASPTAITENQFGNLRMSTNRNLYGTIRDAAGNERGANVDANNNLGVVLAAETTKVLGVTRTADGAGNLLTTNSTTYTAKFGLDGNLLGTLGTAFSTAGKVDVKAADGDVFVRQTTAANLNMTEASAASILTSVQLIDDVVYTDDTSTHATGTSKGALIMGAATPTDTAVNTNDIGAIGMTNNREMYVSLRDNNGTATASGSGTAAAALRVELANNGTGLISTVTSLTQMNGAAISMGTGVRGAGVQRVTIATDDIVPASQSGTWTVQPGNTANSTPWLVTDTPSTTGGLSKFHLVGAATDNATNVKASAGQVYSVTAFNVASTPRYLKFHNTAGTPTAGTAVTDTYLIPGNTAGAGVAINIDKGIVFSTGIGISIVTGIADSNTTAIGASEVVLNIYYK